MENIAVLEKMPFIYDDLDHLPEGNYEIIDGERRDMSPTGFIHGLIESGLAKLLRDYFGNRGYVVVGEVGVVIKKFPLRVRAADIIYINKAKLQVLPKGMLETPPDLIIEVISPDNTLWEMTEKVKDYLSIGVNRVILIDPQAESVSIYQSGSREISTYSFDEEFQLIDEVKVKIKDII
ncbi:MAG: Uma2 family endonuclease [Nitrospirae bacterium]|nr:Uma2 family endonuclease [Nitrospirota bacterium]